MSDLILDNLSVTFATQTILSQLSLQLKSGEIGCLLGASGCGKTTTLRTIAGFEKSSQGSIHLGGRILNDKHTQLPAHQRRIGMVFQDYALFPHLTVAQNIAFGLRGDCDKIARTEEMLNLIGMSDYRKRYPHELSGGQQQRVAIARALAPKPDLILLDEPFSNLDSELRHTLTKEVRELLKTQGTSAFLVTHDKQEAFAIADKIGVLYQGQLQQWAAPEILYRQPTTAYVAQFIGEGTLLDAIVRKTAEDLYADLGFTTLPLPADAWPENAKIQVLIRPEDIRLDPNASIAAALINCDFLGDQCRYTVTTDSGQHLTLRAAAHLCQNIGETLHLDIMPHTLITFPQQ